MKLRTNITFRTVLRSLFSFALLASLFAGATPALSQGDTTHAPVVTQQPAPAQGAVGQDVAGKGETPAQKLAPSNEPGGEAALVLPDLSSVSFLGMNGHMLLMIGLIFCALGLIFGLAIFMHLKNLPVHSSMRKISELIYETCKTYLITQGKFIAVLWVFIAVVIGLCFGVLAPTPGHPVAMTVAIILAFSIIGILGSYGVAWFGIRVNTFANSRTAFASLEGKPFPIYAIPLT